MKIQVGFMNIMLNLDIPAYLLITFCHVIRLWLFTS